MPARPLHVITIVALAAATALACTACSFGPKVAGGAAHLRITADFGTHTVADVSASAAHSRQTDLQALEAHAKITTTPGSVAVGPSVTSINGRPAATGTDRWHFYLNGVEPTKSAAEFTINKGDRFWWDLHDSRTMTKTQAVVGSFPEPFLHGLFGRRYPSTIECGKGMETACAAITAQFTHFHIPLSQAAAGYGSGTDSLSVNVGTWRELRGEVITGLVEKGPGASGVYARFTDSGQRLELENEAGHVVRTLGAGAGMVAAIAGPSDVPTWVVTGTDAAGVAAAAHAMTVSSLAGRFALVVQGGHDYPVPVAGAS